jgi:nucleoside-diphosphate kinase
MTVRRNARKEVSGFLGADLRRRGAQDPPHGRFADLVTEPGQLAVHPAVPQAGFCQASSSTRSRRSARPRCRVTCLRNADMAFAGNPRTRSSRGGEPNQLAGSAVGRHPAAGPPGMPVSIGLPLERVRSDHCVICSPCHGRREQFVAERTLILVKPDGVRRGLIGDVLSRIEAKGLRIAAMDLRTLDWATAEAHYAEHAVKPFFGQLVDFTTAGPLVALVVEGPRAIEAFRVLAGSTDPIRASMGTIRGDHAQEIQHNIVHGSDSPESADREIKIFFPDLV